MHTSGKSSPGPAPARFLARAIGGALPQGGGPILAHSVHRAAIYLRLEGTPMLVCLVSGEYEAPPNGIRLSRKADLRCLGIVPGSAGRIADGLLVLESGGSRRLEVALAGARRDEQRMGARPGRLGVSYLASAVRLESQARKREAMLSLDLIRSGERSRDCLRERLLEGARLLGSAARSRDAAAGRDAVLRLIGLGPGLTPTGDDFLCGFLAGLRAFGSPAEAEESFIAALCATIEASLARTNETSASFLLCAARGFAQASMLGLASALADDSPCEAIACLDRVCNFGHGSGSEAATGFLFGLGLWAQDGEHEPVDDRVSSKEVVC